MVAAMSILNHPSIAGRIAMLEAQIEALQAELDEYKKQA
jgi:uncharacterized small protein (DUF1192 family)